MKKLFSIVLTLGLLLSLASCGASAPMNDSFASQDAMSEEGCIELPMESPMPVPEGEFNSASGENQKAETGRKLVKHSDMDLQTKEFDKALDDIFSSIEEMGGYVEYQQISGNNLYNSGRNSRNAEINARIPSEKLPEAEEKFSSLFNVTNQSSHVEDITDRYFDADARLNSSKAKEKRLLELLDKAETMNDIIAIESKLSDVRYEIESLTSSLNRMDKQVSYSYLNLHLQEVIDYDLREPTFTEKLAGSFKNSGRNLVRWAENSLFFVIEDLPVLLLNVAVLIFIFYAVRYLFRKIGLLKNVKFRFKKKDKTE